MRKSNQRLLVGIATLGLLASVGITPVAAADNAARLAGSNRIETALRVATHAFAGQKPQVIYVANGDNSHLVDATTGGKLADGPLLYTPSDPAKAAELGVMLAQNPTFSGAKQVVALGGSASVHEATLQALAAGAKTGATSRLAGADRFETAEKIAAHIITQAKAGNPAYAAMLDKSGRPRTVYVANGSDSHMVDSMVAGTLGDGPTLLARPDGTLSEGAKQLLLSTKPASITGLGGASAVSDGTLRQAASLAGSTNTSRLGGANRFETAAQVAQRYTQIHGVPTEVYVAGSAAASDAIIAGQLKRGPILLTTASGMTPAATSSVLQSLAKQAGKTLKVYGIGGQNTLPESQLQQATKPNPVGDKQPGDKAGSNSSNSNGGSNSSKGNRSSAGSASGGSSSGGNSSSNGGATPSQPKPAPNVPAPKLTPKVVVGKTTLNLDNEEETEAMVKIGDNVDTKATAEITPATGGIDPLLKLKSPGVYTIKPNRLSVGAGIYKLKFTTGEGKVLPEQEIVVQKKHFSLPRLEALSNVSPAHIATLAEFKNQRHGAEWTFLAGEIKELREKGLSAAQNIDSAMKFEVVNPSSNISAEDLETIKKYLRLNSSGNDYSITTDLPSTVPHGATFTVRTWIEGKGYFLSNDPVEATVTVSNPGGSSGTPGSSVPGGSGTIGS